MTGVNLSAFIIWGSKNRRGKKQKYMECHWMKQHPKAYQVSVKTISARPNAQLNWDPKLSDIANYIHTVMTKSANRSYWRLEWVKKSVLPSVFRAELQPWQKNCPQVNKRNLGVPSSMYSFQNHVLIFLKNESPLFFLSVDNSSEDVNNQLLRTIHSSS